MSEQFVGEINITSTTESQNDILWDADCSADHVWVWPVAAAVLNLNMWGCRCWNLLQFPLLWCKWKMGEVEANGCLQGSALKIRTYWQGGWSLCFAHPLDSIAHFIPQPLGSPSAAPVLSSACWPACSWKNTTSTTLLLKLGLKNTMVLEKRIIHFLLFLQRTMCAWDFSSCSLQL